MATVFASRDEAGRALAPALVALRLVEPIVLALPRGGLPVAARIARALHAPLDVLIVRKIGAPGNPEFAVAALAEGALDHPVLYEQARYAEREAGGWLQRAAAEQEKELSRRLRLYRQARPFPDVAGRTVVLVDDGAATGTTLRAALAALRQHRPARVVVALPVAAPDTAAALATEVDDLVCLQRPADFRAVGQAYANFDQVSDEEALAILEGERRAAAPR